MAELSWSPSEAQTRFFETWRGAGGEEASIDAMIAQAADKAIVTVLSGGVWRNYWMGETHHARNGGVYFGELHRFLPPADYEDYSSKHLRTAQMGIPHWTRVMGSVGAARSMLTHRVSVPVRPPPGAAYAIVSSYEWEEVVSAEVVNPFKAWFEKCYGSEMAGRLEGLDDTPLHLQIEMMRGVVLSVRDRDYLKAILSKSRVNEAMFVDRPVL